MTSCRCTCFADLCVRCRTPSRWAVLASPDALPEDRRVRLPAHPGLPVHRRPDRLLLARLRRKIGLGDQLIGSNDSERKTYIVARGKLVVMPDGLMFMVPT